MQTGEFIAAFREAFGPAPELPLLFRYTDEPLRPVEKVGGCFFKVLAQARDGQPVGLNASNIGCGGGKFYTGFSPMPEFVPQLVSLRERYKQTPEMVLEFIAALDLRPAPKAWIEFVRVDVAGTFEGAEGRAGKPQRRPQMFPGAVRPFGAPMGRCGRIVFRHPDVAFCRDVRHDACKLPVRNPCVG